jgi:hypothetical protein
MAPGCGRRATRHPSNGGNGAASGAWATGLVTARGLGELRDLATLGLGPDATPAMVQAAFRAIVRDYHPDRFHSEPEDVRAQALERFRRAREAYERLAPE